MHPLISLRIDLSTIMGRTRRLLQRLWGRRDKTDQVAGAATRNLSVILPESPDVGAKTSEPDLTVERDGKDTAKELWLAAYKKLEEEEGTKGLIEAYESLLCNRADGKWIVNVFFI